LQKTADGFAVSERDPWEVFTEGCRELSEDFLTERNQPSLERRHKAIDKVGADAANLRPPGEGLGFEWM
jgi:hypothetical protein